MNKILIVLMALFLIAGCGKKGNPVPKATLNIPTPDWVELTIEEGGVRVVNNSPTYNVLLERAVSELGDLSFPSYKRLARVQPREIFFDNTTEQDVRYIYRLTTIHNRYDAYSQPITKVVSFKGAVSIDRIETEIKNNLICIDMEVSKSVTKTQVYLNGQEVFPDKNNCFPLPLTAQLLLVVVPYSESGIPGKAYSETINRDLSSALLPPQNMRVIRSGDNITLSWDSAKRERDATKKDEEYQVTVNGTKVPDISATIFSWKADAGKCVHFTIRSLYGGEQSEALNIRSCP